MTTQLNQILSKGAFVNGLEKPGAEFIVHGNCRADNLMR